MGSRIYSLILITYFLRLISPKGVSSGWFRVDGPINANSVARECLSSTCTRVDLMMWVESTKVYYVMTRSTMTWRNR
jgi:hypothetical protein